MNLRRLVQQFIDSRSQFDLLMAMAADPERPWNAQEVVDAFGVTRHEARQHLESLCARNILDVRIGNTLEYRFAPGAPDVADAMQALVLAYRTRPDTLGGLITERMNPHAGARNREGRAVASGRTGRRR